VHFLWEGLIHAVQLLLSGDAEILQIALLSLQVSGFATAISLGLGLPLGTFLALGSFPTRKFWISLVNTGMALPPVVVGLVVSIFLWRSGPLGDLHWMYTSTAIVIAQTIIAAPVVTGLTLSALQQLDPRLRLQLLGLGASRSQMVWAMWREARLPLLAALMAGFGSVISEVGASMMVGGNIRYHTRVLTTAIVMETSKGEFAVALALSAILLLLAYLVNLGLTWIQQRNVRKD
jgi:tungstate transport system permease protein